MATGDATATELAKGKFRELRLLSDSALVDLARGVLAVSLAQPTNDLTTFTATVWRGKYDIGDEVPGTRVNSTLGEFVSWLQQRALVVAPKGTGYVCCPTVNRDGRRVNVSTEAMTALNLDADEAGEWHALLDELEKIGLSYVAYRSGGHRDGKPKWHILIPFARPFDTSSPEKIVFWKSAYNSARVLFGALADLRGEGFDPTVETPCAPVFITERRNEADSPREVRWYPGRALDIDAMVAALPQVEDESVMPSLRSRAAVERVGESGVDRIVDMLLPPMQAILSGRRDLYLALPGALLDRGVAPEDVRSIVEDLSSNCQGDPSNTSHEIRAKHREHLHCADTTISKWEAGEEYTRIGTIAGRWPDVARAIDAALPDPFLLEIKARIDAMQERHRGRVAQAAGAASVPAFASSITVQTTSIDVSKLRSELRTMRRKKAASKRLDDKVRSVMIGAFLDGDDLVPKYDGEDGKSIVACNVDGKPYDAYRSVTAVAAMVGSRLPTGTAFEHVQYMFERAVRATAASEMPKLMAAAEQSFLRAVGRKLERDDAVREQARQFRTALDAVDLEKD